LKKFDDEFPEFGKESRNIRLGLATDGMNPFGNMSTVEPSGVQALKNPNPLKDVEASVVLDVAVLV